MFESIVGNIYRLWPAFFPPSSLWFTSLFCVFHVETCNISKFVCLHPCICLCANILCGWVNVSLSVGYFCLFLSTLMSVWVCFLWQQRSGSKPQPLFHHPLFPFGDCCSTSWSLTVSPISVCLMLPFSHHLFPSGPPLYICPFFYDLFNLVVYFMSPLSFDSPSNSGAFVASKIYSVPHSWLSF